MNNNLIESYDAFKGAWQQKQKQLLEAGFGDLSIEELDNADDVNIDTAGPGSSDFPLDNADAPTPNSGEAPNTPQEKIDNLSKVGKEIVASLIGYGELINGPYMAGIEYDNAVFDKLRSGIRKNITTLTELIPKFATILEVDTDFDPNAETL